MIDTHLGKMKTGKVYEAEFIMTKDSPADQVIATQFYVKEIDDYPVQVYNYSGKYSKQDMERWYTGKYQIPYQQSETLEGTKWYIWLPPNNPRYLKVIEKIKHYDYTDNTENNEDSFWNKPF